MAKKNVKKKNRWPLIFIVFVIIVAAGVYTMFFAFPNAESIKDAMLKADFEVFSDINPDTPLFGLALPDGAERSIKFIKTLNGDIFVVEVTYFDSYQSAKTFYDEMEVDSDEAKYVRGNVLINGTAESAKDLRWKIWS